jgi:hypothetical protein
VKHLNTSFARFAWLAILLIMAHIVPAQIGAGTKPIYSIEFKPGPTTAVVVGAVATPKTVGPDMTNEGSEGQGVLSPVNRPYLITDARLAQRYRLPQGAV